MGLLTKLLTKNKNEIPLFFVTFNWNKFKSNREIGSCDCKIHPLIKNDEHVKQAINDIVDYIRDKYDMNLIP